MEKLSLKTKISYGVIGIGDSAFYNMMGTFALFFLTTIAGISPAIAGTIVAIGAVWETICGAFIGYISDHTDTRFGKRKPYILSAAFPLAFFTSMMFINIDASPQFKIAYYLLALLLFWTCFSIFFVPYLSWGAELTQNYNERTVLRGYVYLFNTLGTAIGMILPNIIVDALIQAGQSANTGWSAAGIFCGLCGGLSIFFGALLIKDKYERAHAKGQHLAENSETTDGTSRLSFVIDMLKNYRDILQLRTTRYILAASVFYLIGYAIFSSGRMYFFTYNMELSAGTLSFVLFFLAFVSTAFVPAIMMISKRLDKRTIFIAGMSLCGLVTGFFGITGVPSLAWLLVFSFIYCIGSICYWQLIPAMIYDVCEVDQLVNGTERAGLIISLQSLSESIANAVGLQLLGIILDIAGFDGSLSVQSDTALLWTHLCFSLIPAVFTLISAFMIWKYPVSGKVYNKILEALESRKQGNEPDLSEFKHLK